MTFGGVDLAYAKGINLPSYDDYKNLKSAKKLAIDIGGSLVKIVYLSEVEHRRKRLNSLSSADVSEESIEATNQQPVLMVEEKELSEERLYFKKFETKYVDEGLKFIKENLLSYGSDRSNKVLHATGGGAIKYKDLIESTLDVKVEKEDEIECLINGCNFLLKNLQDESFAFQMKEDETPELKFQDLSQEDVFPYLLVNIGSGVSIIKVEGTDKYERIGGTSTGGGTFWGLGSLLTDAKGFDELLEMAIDGKTKNVDMLVKDIYGKGYDLMKLPAELVASSFGKASRASGDSSGKEETSKKFRPQDIAKALLRMISNDIGQISSLYAQVHGLTRIIFAGYFIRGHPVTMQTMSYAVKYFSKDSQQALFLRHEGYLGAVGAFLASAASMNSSFHWNENYAAMIAADDLTTNPEKSYKMYDYETFELDRVEQAFEKLPLLISNENTHSDLINLGADKEAREYWLDKLENGMDEFMYQAVRSQDERKDATARGEQMKDALLKRLCHLRSFPYALGKLTIRSLLELCNQFLILYDFNDTWLGMRQSSTESALSGFQSHLKAIDSLDSKHKEEMLILNLVAANSLRCQEFFECIASLALLEEQKQKLQARPWLQDDLHRWLERSMVPPSHTKVAIFVDKSGIDIVLGVFPFVRHLLQHGSKVVLAANTGFAKDGILYDELVVLADRLGELCPIVEKSLKCGDLEIMETGSCSECLQLRVISHPLAMAMATVDLVVLLGADRAIYTNYKEQLSCDTIRCSVIHDPWLASHLDGKVNDVVFKFDHGYTEDDDVGVDNS